MELRPPRREDAPAIAEVARRFGLGEQPETPADVENWFDIPSNDLERNARVAVRDGSVVGYGDVGDAYKSGKLLWLDVRAEAESAVLLLDFVERRAMQLAAAGAKLKIWSPEGNTQWRALVESRGYAFDRYSFRMWIDLSDDPPAPEWPEGISVGIFRRETDERRVYETHQEAFSEERDFAADPFDDWTQWSYREPFDPGVWFLAEDGGELAGIALCRPERGGDESVGWINILGVRKPWRGRGLGRALLLHAFHELHRKGKRRVGLGVDGDNATAIRLYERAGMQPKGTLVWYQKGF
jgi:mycothiol synthase